MGPREAQSAEEDPEMPPKKKEATTLTMAAPPRIQPTSSFEKAIRVSVMPPALINSPDQDEEGHRQQRIGVQIADKFQSHLHRG